MKPCHHITGHRSGAHGALCLAIRRAQEFRHVDVPGVSASRVLVRAYEAESGADVARIREAAATLDAFAAAAAAILDPGKPASARRAA